MDELIDIYNENGQFIEQNMKSIAHKNGLWHKSIHSFLINSKNEIIIQKRSKDKDLYPGKWDMSFAGHISAGENALNSVIRECYEELGINLAKNEIEYIFSFKDTHIFNKIINNEFVDVFICHKEFTLDNIKKQDEEVDDVKIIPLKDYISMLENNNKSLVPHQEENKLIIPILYNILNSNSKN